MLQTFKIMIPQIIFLVMVALEAIIVTAKNGEQKTGKYNAGTYIITITDNVNHIRFLYFRYKRIEKHKLYRSRYGYDFQK